MAQGLRCPHCGHKHPVAQLPGTPTFRCTGCGQVLKTPREYRTSAAEGGGGAASETRRVAPNAPSTYSRPVPRASQAARADSEYAGEATEALPAVTPRTRPRAAQSPNGAGAGRAVGV